MSISKTFSIMNYISNCIVLYSYNLQTNLYRDVFDLQTVFGGRKIK